MEAVIHLDIHVVVWLYSGAVDRLSPQAAALIDAHELRVSPMVALELQYLEEIGRLTAAAGTMIDDLRQRAGLAVCVEPFSDVIDAAVRCVWTRDPFDRIIVGQAALVRARLLTKDHIIRAHYSRAVW